MTQPSKGVRKWLVVGLIAAGAMTYLLATTFAGSATGAQSQSTTTWITVSGSGFIPESDDCFDYDHDGFSGLINDQDECEYVADVTLPHGSTVREVHAYFDADGQEANLHLEENDSDGDHTDIANISMDNCEVSDGHPCIASDFHPDSPGVNNSHHSYGLWLNVNDCCRLRPLPSGDEGQPAGRRGDCGPQHRAGGTSPVRRTEERRSSQRRARVSWL